MLGRGRNQCLDLFGRSRRPLRQRPHFRSDHGKALARISGARGLDPGVQGQQIGLEGDIVNRTNDLRDLLGRFFNLGHRRYGTLDDDPTLIGRLARLPYNPFNLTGTIGSRFDRCRQFVQRCRSLLQGSRLVFSTA